MQRRIRWAARLGVPEVFESDPVGAAQGGAVPERERPADRRERAGDRRRPRLPESRADDRLRYDWGGPDDPARALVEKHETLIVPDVAARFSQFKDPFGEGMIKSWMAVPLLVGDRLIGMLTFDSFEPDFYTAEHARTAEAFAAFAATAIDKARYLDELQRARERAETLLTVTQVLGKTLVSAGHDRNDPRRAAAGRALRQLLGPGDPGRPPGDRRWPRLRRSGRPARAAGSTGRRDEPEQPGRAVEADAGVRRRLDNPHFASDFHGGGADSRLDLRADDRRRPCRRRDQRRQVRGRFLQRGAGGARDGVRGAGGDRDRECPPARDRARRARAGRDAPMRRRIRSAARSACPRCSI